AREDVARPADTSRRDSDPPPRAPSDPSPPVRSEESFRSLIERLPDAVIVHRAGRVVYANPAAVSMHGHDSLKSLAGIDIMDLIHPDERKISQRRVRAIEGGNNTLPVRERRMLRRDGSTFVAEVTGIQVLWEGEPAVAAVANDVTEKRQLLAELAQRDQLASMGMLAASVAHEVNNPITYVLLNLERLRTELPQVSRSLSNLRDDLACELGEDRATELFERGGGARALAALEMLVERAQTATEGARQVGRIARDLKAFARVEHDSLGPVDVNTLLDKVLDIAANELRFRAGVVRSYGDLPLVSANEGRLSQVFLNLLVNAAHAIDEGAPERNTVRVTTSHDAGEVRIAVADTGHGIAPEHLQRLFDPFFTTKERGQGAGLGLSICRDIVRAHGGRIDVESEVGRGTKLTIHLPVGEVADAGLSPPSTQIPLANEARRPRVLVIDDESTLRSTLAALLEDRFEVVLAESGTAAFDLLITARDYDVILCDLMMPDTSGMQVHAWVQREAPELLPRMVFMTGGAFTRNAREFLENVANRYIEKPFDVADLVTLLHKVARRSVVP
ncbi:MAG: ATP-binding protein, partial [Polyangiaceae bacterium]